MVKSIKRNKEPWWTKNNTYYCTDNF